MDLLDALVVEDTALRPAHCVVALGHRMLVDVCRVARGVRVARALSAEPVLVFP